MGLPFVFITGRFVDKLSVKIMVPFTLIFQIVLMLLYMQVTCPNHWLGWVCAVPQAGSSYMVIVSMQAYLSKRTPKMIRGVIFAVIGMISSLGTVLYLQVAKVLVKTHDNDDSWNFTTIAIFDLIMLVVLLVSIFFGWYG